MAKSYTEISSYLFSAFDKLRGIISSAEAAELLLGIIFLRFISKDSDSKDSVPVESLWNNIKVSQNVSESIISAIHSLEYSEYRVVLPFLSDVGWVKLREYPDLCHELIEIVSEISDDNLQIDNIGIIAETLFLNLSNTLGPSMTQYFTPPHVARLLVELLNPKPNESVYDPACGSGGLLLLALQHMTSSFNDKKKQMSRIVGEEVNQQIASVAAMNAIFYGLPPQTIINSNSLLNPKGSETTFNKFDIVLSDIPFGIRLNEHERERLEQVRSKDFIYGHPSRFADFNFIQHAISSLKNKGRAALLVSPSVLFRTGEDAIIRKNLVENDLIDAIISLPSNLLPYTSIPSTILILSKDKPSDRKNRILFIYADDEFEFMGRSQRIITEQNRTTIVEALKKNVDQPQFCKSVTIQEIGADGYRLVPAKYVGVNDIEIFLGKDVQWVQLYSIANIKQGISLRHSIKGKNPIIQGRDLAASRLSIDDLERKYISSKSSKEYLSQNGDILIQRIGQRPKILLIEKSLTNLIVSDTVYIIRLYKPDPLLARYLIDFFNSDAGQSLIAAST